MGKIGTLHDLASSKPQPYTGQSCNGGSRNLLKSLWGKGCFDICRVSIGCQLVSWNWLYLMLFVDGSASGSRWYLVKVWKPSLTNGTWNSSFPRFGNLCCKMGIRVVYKNQPLGFRCEYQSPEDSQGFEVCQSRKSVVCKFSYSLIFIHSHHDDVILTLSHSWCFWRKCEELYTFVWSTGKLRIGTSENVKDKSFVWG